MFHEERRYGVTDVATAEELARLLSEHTWTCCTGFRLGDLLFLNDSTGEDGAQEYAVFKNDRKIETIAFGWCTRSESLMYIEQLQSRPNLDLGPMKVGKIETPKEHGTCPLCA